MSHVKRLDPCRALGRDLAYAASTPLSGESAARRFLEDVIRCRRTGLILGMDCPSNTLFRVEQHSGLQGISVPWPSPRTPTQ